MRLVIPTVVMPRYGSEMAVAEPGSEGSADYGLTFQLSVEMMSMIKAIKSPSHDVEVVMDERRGQVMLKDAHVVLDRDLVVLVACEETHVPRAVMEEGPDGTRAVMLAFYPYFNVDDEVRSELVFLIDRSGSMAGQPITEAGKTLYV